MSEREDATAGAETTSSDGGAASDFGKAIAQAAAQSGLGAISATEAPSGKALFAAMGGVRGLFEAILPGIVFLVPFTVLTSMQSPAAQQLAMPVSLGASVAIAVVFTIVRVVQRSQITQSVAGLIGVAASAILALLTGNANNNFLLGFAIDAAYAVAVLISMLVRWPVLGLVIGYLMGDGVAWRGDRAKLRAMQILTGCWLALFAVRLAVELPLYFAGLTVALGVVKLALGLPLYASLVLVSWLVARAVYPPKKPEQASDD